MIKAVATYIISFSILFALIYVSQNYILNASGKVIRFSLWDTNMFFALSSFIICIHFQFFSGIKSIQPQLGFIYLPTLFIKGILFFLMFKTSIFELEALLTAEKLNLLIPLFLFLGLEVFFVVKIITKNET
ncbi:DUF6168 family protein [uncultured Winogradskyella sp.]|uniref:DUF6168 family protein n=1 Tax=Winogradskyella sp. 4-2091 TaxID=3381659 RepID=UPI00345C57D9